MNQNTLSVGDRVRHEEYSGIGLVDEVTENGVSVNWCEMDDAWHYMRQDFPLFTSGLQLVEKAQVLILEDA